MILDIHSLLEIGKISKTHGYEGNVRIELDEHIEISKEEPLFLMFDQKPVPFFMSEISQKRPYIIHFDDVDTIDQAKELIGKSLYLPILENEDDAEMSFIDYEVIDQNLGSIGKIAEIIENASQDLLVVKQGDKEILIPFVDEFIEHVNDDNMEIHMIIPEGLIDMN